MRDDGEIRAVLDRLVETWDAADADGYGDCFTADASYITFLGTIYRGRTDIVRSHRALFGSFLKGVRLASEVVEIRYYGDDLAIATTRGDTYRKAPGALSKVQTYTLVREPDGRWRVAAFHNTKRKPLMESMSFRQVPQSRPAE